MSSEPKMISMTERHLEDVIAATVCIGGLATVVEALRDAQSVMGVPCGDIVAAFDEWMDKVRAVITASMDGIDSRNPAATSGTVPGRASE